MPEMRQHTTNPHREIRAENRAAILGLLGVSQVPDDAKTLEHSP